MWVMLCLLCCSTWVGERCFCRSTVGHSWRESHHWCWGRRDFSHCLPHKERTPLCGLRVWHWSGWHSNRYIQLAHTLCICSHFSQLLFCFINTIEGVDFVLSASRFTLANMPISITVMLRTDGVAGEPPEEIILTLKPDRDPESNEILPNPAITIDLRDNESMW